ncbi:MAG: choice-of-anchor Q domain-containing protein, partial [Verrucomicrobiota bacterium]
SFSASDSVLSSSDTLTVTTNTTIDGSGFGITFSGNNVTRVFNVASNITANFRGVAISNGLHTNGAGLYNSNGIVLLTNCTFVNNNAFGTNGAAGANATSGNDGGNGKIGTNAVGGAIYNLGTLSIFHSSFSSNSASGGDGGNGGNSSASSSLGGKGGNGGNGGIGWGGGIYNKGTVMMADTMFTGNFALGGFAGNGGEGGTASFPGTPGEGGRGGIGSGGAIYNDTSGIVWITNSTFYTNGASGGDTGHAAVNQNGNPGAAGFGGAIYNLGTLGVTNSTYALNTAEGGKGGDVYSGNFLFAGNGGAGGGGAIYSTNQLFIVSCTFATNNSFGGPPGQSPYPDSGNQHDGSTGAALGGDIYRVNGQARLRNTLLVRGTSGPNFTGTVVDDGYNLSSDATPTFTQATSHKSLTNVFLAPLATNGGFTLTLALLPNTPAVDKGDPTIGGFDQRGIARPQGTNTDVGAFELVPTFSISGQILERTNSVGMRGVGGVVVTAGTASAVSQTNGNYFISGLLTSNYVVMPTLVGSGFTPTNTNVFVGIDAGHPFPGTNATNVNFLVNPATTILTAGFISTNPTNSLLTLDFLGAPQRSYRIQALTNLNLTNWVNLSTNLSDTNGGFQFLLTNFTQFPQRYFRALPFK